MKNTAPKPKERQALLRFEIICHIKTLRQEGVPLAQCMREVASRPWPAQDGRYYADRTIETWWYDYGRKGYDGIAGKTIRSDAGKSRQLDEETGLWIINALHKNPKTPLSVLYRHWEKNGRSLPSQSTVRRFLKTKGYDPRSLKAGRLECSVPRPLRRPRLTTFGWWILPASRLYV